MDRVEYGYQSDGDPVGMICPCGNTPSSGGFETCDETGLTHEPSRNWVTDQMHVVCVDCRRIFPNQNGDEIVVLVPVVGIASEDVWRKNVIAWEDGKQWYYGDTPDSAMQPFPTGNNKCDCPNDSVHCPHCGRIPDLMSWVSYHDHLNRCHQASIGTD